MSEGRRTPWTTGRLADGVLAGDRTALGKAITLIESNAPGHQDQAQELLQRLLPHTGGSIRVGITGTPGAGKSTLIEAMGGRLTADGKKVAVTAVDPSSSRSKGSILGDKTRMEGLSRDPNAFIRPSPSGGSLGGVARKTRETLLLFEAAGYDVILVETVGVGQSEIAVRSMVDFFLLVLIPGGGDELQGLKRGIVELADAIVINKADGDNVAAAEAARGEYEQALHYLPPATEGWTSFATSASAIEGTGLEELWSRIEEFEAKTRATGALQHRRQRQAVRWMHALIDERLRGLFEARGEVKAALADTERQVLEGKLPATQAARELLDAFESSRSDD